jgi:hypothetical protein
MTVNIEHNLKFVTEVDETHPIGARLLALDETLRIQMLEGMLKDLLVPALLPEIDKINEGGSYAILKVVR